MNALTSLLEDPHRKPAQADHPIHDLIALRWSPRAFVDEEVTEHETQQLFEAVRWAMSSSNEQPWGFVAASRYRDEAAFNRLLGCLNMGNRTWAAAAPLLVLAAVRPELSSKHGLNRTATYDVGQSVAFLTFQATALGIAVHQMAGFDLEAARLAGRIPAGWEPLTMMAIGRPGDPARLNETLRQRELAPRVRKQQGDFLSWGAWGQSKRLGQQ